MNTKVKVFISSLSVAGLTAGMAIAPALASSVNIGNSHTGFNSVNTGVVTLTQSIVRLVSEFVHQVNSGVVNSNTGNNAADANTGNGATMSGGVNFSGGFENMPTSAVGPVISLGDLFSARADNDTTGANSVNLNDINASSTAVVDVTRLSNFVNSVVANAQTGNNSASMNTGNGAATSGNVMGNVMVGNHVPAAGSGPIIVGGGSASVDVGNDTTGFNSLNTNNVDLNKVISVGVTEHTSISNSVVENANTGNNNASMNTGDGVVHSGGVNSSTSVHNTSSTAAPVVIDAGAPATVKADNDTTGANSVNTNNVNLTRTLVVDVNTTTNTTNSLTVNSDTGNNSASMNTGNGIVTTGNVNASFNVTNN